MHVVINACESFFQEIIGSYIIMEEFYMRETVNKVITFVLKLLVKRGREFMRVR
jgi:hypothetical protein